MVYVTTNSNGSWDIRDKSITKNFTSYVSDSSFSIATIERLNTTTLRITPHQNVTIAYALKIGTTQTVTYTEESVTAEQTKSYTLGTTGPTDKSFFKIY